MSGMQCVVRLECGREASGTVTIHCNVCTHTLVGNGYEYHYLTPNMVSVSYRHKQLWPQVTVWRAWPHTSALTSITSTSPPPHHTHLLPISRLLHTLPPSPPPIKLPPRGLASMHSRLQGAGLSPTPLWLSR